MEQIHLHLPDMWQEAIVGHMLRDYNFFLNAKMHIQSGWFTNPFVREIVNTIYSMYDEVETKRLIKYAEVDGRIYQKQDTRTHQEYRLWLAKCDQSSKQIGLDLVSKDLTTWLRIVKLRNMLAEGESIFNKRQYDKATLFLKDSIKDIVSTDFAPPPEANFSNPLEDFKSRNVELSDCMTIGHHDFDEKLREGSLIQLVNPTAQDLSDISKLTRGALAHGDSTVLVGPTNAGKTTVCITIISANLKMKKDILYITLEQKERDIKTKLYQAFAAKTGPECSRLEANQQHTMEVLVASGVFKERLTYVSYTDPTKMYVEDVLNLIESYNERRKCINGKGYDLVVVDYPGKLHSRAYMNRRASGWEEKTYIYEQFYMMANHHNFHGIYPVQTNREGFKINKGASNQFIDTDDVAQAFNLTHGADNIITINRSPEDELKHIIQFYVAKSRLGPKGWAFMSKTDFARSRTHGIGLPYKIDSTGDKSKSSANADTLLKTNPQIDASSVDVRAIMKSMESLPGQQAFSDEQMAWISSLEDDSREEDDIVSEGDQK